MSRETVRWSTGGRVTRLWLCRPQALNPLGEEEARQFSEALSKIAKEKSRVLIVTGEGAGFSAGGDMAFIEKNRSRAKAELPAVMKNFYSSFLNIRGLPQVTIAQINGPAIGAGMCLALACDLRTTLSTSRLALSFTRLGLNPGMGAWPLARAAFGDARARDLLLTGRFFSGQDLYDWGAASLTSEKPDQLEELTLGLANELAALSWTAVGILKKEMSLGDTLDKFLTFEAEGQADCFKGPDVAEGVAAIRGRRQPKF
jgi:enoyl-CoA hydratase/carnithine racemase